jgi:DNA primase
VSPEFDFEEYIKDNFDYVSQKGGEELLVNCFNSECPSTKKKLSVNVRYHVAKCWVCGKTYNAFTFLRDYEGLTSAEARRRLGDALPRDVYDSGRLNVAIRSLLRPLASVSDELVKVPRPAIRWPVTIPVSRSSRAAEYLRGRGFGEEVWRHFQLSFCPFGYFGGRVIIPIIEGGRRRGFQARDVTGKSERRYLFPKGIDPDLLYNWEQARQFKNLIIVEGVTSLWAVWNQGLLNTTASFGKKLTRGQRRKILSNEKTERIFLMWDADAYVRMMEEYHELAHVKEILLVYLPRDTDPADHRDVRPFLKSARPFSRIDFAESWLRQREDGLG